MALIVLGAGATRGASFAESSTAGGVCLPPLDGDFFTQLQRICNSKHKATIDNVIKDVVELFGNNFSVSLETMFTTVEHTLRMVRATKGGRRYSAADLEKMRTDLLQGIAAVLEESLTKGDSSRDLQVCEYHQSIVEKMTASDAIISFNYDCLIDVTLKLHGDNKWNARYGYHLPLPLGRNKKNIGERWWNPVLPATRDKTIRLLKLHGSVHFSKVNEKLFNLKQRPYTKQKGNLRFEIIPPEWNKHFDEGVFGILWSKARDEIHSAKTIIVIGYSFPPTDLHASALFRVGVRKQGLKNVVIVNPDSEAHRRTLDVLRHGMDSTTRVLVFDSLKEFSTVKRSLWPG